MCRVGRKDGKVYLAQYVMRGCKDGKDYLIECVVRGYRDGALNVIGPRPLLEISR